MCAAFQSQPEKKIIFYTLHFINRIQLCVANTFMTVGGGIGITWLITMWGSQPWMLGIFMQEKKT
jgi:hypothetical protein